MAKTFSCIVLIFVLLTAFMVSCAPQNAKAIKSLDDLPGGFDGPHVQNIGPHSAEIIFKFQVPVVCNVAYGKDTKYGNIALMAMTGPLTDHDVSLLSLDPDTRYHYRITITDTSATIYQSGDFTFSTVKANGDNRPAGINVAAAASGATIIGVSSNWGNGDLNSPFGGNKAIDGRQDTAWSSNGDGDKAWIEIGLAQSYDLSTIGFQTRTMGDSAQIYSFKVVTDNGTQLGPFNLPDAATVYYFPVSVRAKTLRFEVISSSGGNTGAVEIEAYAK